MNFDNLKKHWPLYILLVLFISNIFLFNAVLHEWPTSYFTIAFLDVGQGDAIYIESPTHNRMLIDGGPPHALLGALRKVTPFYNRSIDTLFVTNPDADHFAGFIDLLQTYSVKRVIEPGTQSATITYKTFEEKIKEKQIEKIIGTRGMTIHLGSSTNVTILFPDRDVSSYATNNGSIIAKLSYGSSSVMLTGDAPSAIEEYTMELNGPAVMKSTLLKVGHHGSRTSASELFSRAVSPLFAIASAGLDNTYGHPHKETIELFDSLHIPLLVTFQEGTIIFRCDIKSCWRV